MTNGPHRTADQSARPFGMKDVGQLAGVSHTTVWRVLNGERTVGAETRERVRWAIDQLGYRLNPAARTLVTRRSNTVGVITTETAAFGSAAILRSFERAARAAGYFVTITSVGVPTRDALHEAIERLRDQAVEGVLALVAADAITSALAGGPLPMVTIGARPRRASGVVGVETGAGAAMATAHLLELGHATVHHVSGPLHSLDARLRRAAWQRTLRAAGARQPRYRVGDWTARSGYELGLRLAADPDLTAVFCANDHMAIGVLRALSEMDRRVPDEVSVVGFGDIPEAEYMTPPLTTVKIDFEALGQRCMAMLHALMSGADPTVSGRTAVVAELAPRGSSARAPRPTSARRRRVPRASGVGG